MRENTDTECGKCGYHGIGKVAGMNRCGNCGNQWGPRPAVNYGPTRAEVLGDPKAFIRKGFII